MTQPYDVAIVGAGVLGAFHAYFCCRRGLRTVLIERSDLPRQASVRNFGMVIPSGMTPGDWLRRAMRSAVLYRELAGPLGVWLHRGGTQYLATTPGELRVLEEFAKLGPGEAYRCELLDAEQSVLLNPAVRPETCKASLYFPDDLRFDQRTFLSQLIPWMAQEMSCNYVPETPVLEVAVEKGVCRVTAPSGVEFRAKHVFVCTGADFRTLFPARFAASGFLHCKLQMLRLAPQPKLRINPSLASGLSLRHYPSFRLCPSWPRLEAEFVEPEVTRRGVHILLVQREDGSLVLGDSHEYFKGDWDDWLDTRTEELILQEAQRLFRLEDWKVIERWHGVYTLHAEQAVLQQTIGERIHLVTGIGGKGMTTGPGLAEESVARVFGGEGSS